MRRVLTMLTLLLGAAAPLAKANSVELSLGLIGGAVSAPVPGPWATVGYTLNPDGTVTAVVSMMPGLVTSAMDFNVDGSTAGLNVTGLPAGYEFGVGQCSIIGFGSYTACFSTTDIVSFPAVSALDLTISRDEGFSSLDQLLQPTSGYPYTADVALLVETPTADWSTASGPYTPEPEPGTCFLFGTGLIFVWAARSFKPLNKREDPSAFV